MIQIIRAPQDATPAQVGLDATAPDETRTTAADPVAPVPPSSSTCEPAPPTEQDESSPRKHEPTDTPILATTSISSSTCTGIPDSWKDEIVLVGPAKEIDDAYERGDVPTRTSLEGVAQEWGLVGDGARSAAVTMACLMCFPAQTKDGDQRTVANLQKWSGYDRALIEDTLARIIWNGIWAEGGTGQTHEISLGKHRASVAVWAIVAPNVPLRP